MNVAVSSVRGTFAAVLVGAVIALDAGMAHGGEFLDSLATNVNLVSASPCATGGDLVLRLVTDGTVEYVHVFTNTLESAAFTPAVDIYDARVLLVGGGGAGGAGYGGSGGGGAGGFLELSNCDFTSGTAYAVTIGAGGAGFGANNPTFIHNGNDTIFADWTAYGGGGGGTANVANGGDGGSGGGGGMEHANGFGGKAIDGQGHDGSDGNCGSGGGAGGPARRYQAGVGKASDILGESVLFAGGGGGVGGKGGEGGGGDGSGDKTKCGEPGEDGLGGGGGGFLYQNSGSLTSGSGGSGIAIVRYVSVLGEEAIISPVDFDYPRETRLTVSGRVLFCGEGADAVSATLEYWEKGADPATKQSKAIFEDAAAGASFKATLEGFVANTEYVGQILLENNQGVSCIGRSVAFAMPAVSLAASVSGLEADAYVKLTEVDGCDEVFVFTNNATFSVANRGYAKILVVGGGGGGYGRAESGKNNYGGGGGGAGGYVYRTNVLLEPGDYDIVIGAGGAGGSGAWNSNGHKGGNSSFGEILEAIGGGGGHGPVGATPHEPSGGSGAGAWGGASYSYSYEDIGGNGYGLGIEGQGHHGGFSRDSIGACGGGGAGAVGGASKTSSGLVVAGDGGEGLANDITGVSRFYAGGGGGGTLGGTPGAGGLGGGGAGGDGTVRGEDGTDGLGGGGGGGGDPADNGSGRGGGRGGCGTVIVRYTDFSKITASPNISVVPVSVDKTSVVFNLNIISLGDGTALRVIAEIGYDMEHLGAPVVLDENCIQSGNYEVTGLSPGRSYVIRVTVDNGIGGDEALKSASLTAVTLAAISADPPSCAHASYSYSFSLPITAIGDCETVANLYVQDVNGDYQLRGTKMVTEPGTLVFDTDFAPLDYADQTVKYYCELVNTDGDCAWTNVTDWAATKIVDDATYTWTGEGEDENWTTPKNWTSTATGLTLGYPIGSATVNFPKLDEGIDVHLDTSVSQLGMCILNNESPYFRLWGDGSQKLSFSSLMILQVANGVKTILDGVNYEIDLSSNWLQYTGNNPYILQLKNGAYMRAKVAGTDFYRPNFTLLVESGSQYVFDGEMKAGGNLGTRIELNNGIMQGRDFTFSTGASNDLTVVIRGTNSNFSARFVVSGITGGFVFDPTYPLTRTPVSTGDAFPTSSGALTLSMQQGKRTALYRESRSCDLTLVEASRINVDSIVFSAVQREGDYFYFEDANGDRYLTAEEIPVGVSAKKIGYHHCAVGGLSISVK